MTKFMRVINVHEAKTHLSKILDEVKAGEDIILAKMGKPYARLSPLESPKRVPMGFLSWANWTWPLACCRTITTT